MTKPLRALFAVLLLGLGTLAARAQTFTFNTASPIPDTCNNLCYPIAVQGLPAIADTGFGLTSVCLNVTHTYDSDLTIVLKTPTGIEIPLINRAGGSGHNFVGTCLAEDGIALVANGSAPFTGVFRPEGDLNTANDSINPNGVWRLCFTDNAAQDFGILNSFSLTFGPHPPTSPPPPPTPCSFSAMISCDCPDGSDTCDLLPDMTASARIMMDQHTELQGSLRISNCTPNIGYGPLEIHGTGVCYCDSVLVACGSPCPSLIKEEVIQTIYHKMGNDTSHYTRPAGYMSYHPSHGHTHVDNWSQFTLRTRTTDPNPLNWPIVGRGHKVSFCLVNLTECHTANGFCVANNGHVLDRDSMVNSGLGSITGCGRDQGIWPGNADIYDQTLDGQEVDLTDVCNGDYYLVSYTDPDNIFKELDDSNNVAYAPITISRQVLPAATTFVLTHLGATEIGVSANIPAGTRFEWDFGDGTTDTSANPTFHDYATPGQYTVRLTIHYKCGDRFTQQSSVITATKGHLTPAELALTAEPNPSTGGNFTVKFRKAGAGAATLRVTDLAGRTLHTQTVEGDAGLQTVNLHLGDLASGAYMLQLGTSVGSSSLRLMVR